eukprot:TRINITY_DN794_c0_g1_i4.p1 TRINITY_DN794_c0_g1~~TRINITY_DN794_c0_g1_i4.p1  ORF type:complete len:168 (-),score=44.18 TRINITY_DN794_c0_g1_i4:173-631(-)
MARNHEKNLTQLNRLYLEKENERTKRRREERPPLEAVNTAAGLRKWIPTLESEIAYCVRHTSGIRNYSEKKIEELNGKLEEAKKEYQRWEEKLNRLEPGSSQNGELKPYVSKRKKIGQSRNDEQNASQPHAEINENKQEEQSFGLSLLADYE